MGKNTNTPDLEILERYRAGTASPEEVEQVDNWYNAQEQETVPPLLRRRSVAQVNKQIMRSIALHPQRNYQWLKIAAVLLITFTAGFITYNAWRPADRTAVMFTRVSTRVGERKTVVLPDSSRITLNNNSSVSFASNFDQRSRTVALSGEAFFEVRHDTSRPFIVSTKKMRVQVLGTSFDVKAFPDDSYSKVTVSSGKVGVIPSTGQSTKFLLPGDQLEFIHSEKVVKVSKVDPDDQHAWDKGELVFKDEKLVDIVRQLERWYAVRIDIKSPVLKAERFRLRMNNESLEHVLESLSISSDGFHYTIKDKQVTIW